ncbi:MFS transporter [Streptomyces sp. NPDC058252]|uniref:MFS transporter n=1 Tax=Streptomyces sp. NPDC058252 TaxID=3346405 RepID=UPI0036E9CA6B
MSSATHAARRRTPASGSGPRTPRHRARSRQGRASHVSGFRIVAAAFASLMAFGTVPTPLWPLYQQRDHFGATTVTIAYAVMVVGAAFSFRSLGHLSDRIGRRRVIVPALLVAIAAAAVLAAWPALPGLIVGRFLTGVAVGLMASTATAYLTDLHHAAHPDRPHSPVPALVSTAANLGGLAMGPLLAGAAAQWLPTPLVTSYVVFAAVMAAFLVLVLSSPETVDVTLFDGDRPVRFALRPGHGAAFGVASSIGFFAFAVMGLFSSLGAIIVRGQLGISSSFIAGLTTFIAFAASALAQLALGRLTQSRLLAVGVLLFPAGLALTALSLYDPKLWLVVTAAGLAGAGAGLLFKGAVSQTVATADPASRAGVLAVFFVIAYLGLGLPSIAFSLVIQHAALRPSMIGFASALSLGAAVAVALARRGAIRTAS